MCDVLIYTKPANSTGGALRYSSNAGNICAIPQDGAQGGVASATDTAGIRGWCRSKFRGDCVGRAGTPKRSHKAHHLSLVLGCLLRHPLDGYIPMVVVRVR